MRRVLGLLVLLCCYLCCHGNDEENINHLVLLEGLPPSFELTNPPNIVLTTNYSGVVDFKESNELKVLLNISAPTIDEAYAVHSEILSSKGRLLIQVYEDAPPRFALSFPWICICIVMAAAVVASIAIVYVLWWYCSKQYKDIEKDKFSHGNVMYRSRNSMHLSSTNPGESLFLQDNDEHGDDTLREVPEEEEGGAIEMRKMRRSVGRYDEEELNAPTERVYVKQRYMSSAQKLHQERVKREGRRKRHPSLNDPPSYNTVMEYPHDSSDESDGETSTKKKQLEPLLESSNSIDKQSEHAYQTMHRTPEVPAFRSFDLPLNTTARSDGELDRRNSGRGYRSPYSVSNIIRGRPTAPASIPDEGRRSRASNIIYSNHTSRDSVQTVIRRSNSRDSTPSHRTSRDSIQARELSSKLDSPSTTDSARSQSPYQVPVMADVHKDTSKSSDSSSGIVKMQTVAGPPLQPIMPYEPALQATVNSNPMDIPLTSFKQSLSDKRKNIPSPLAVPAFSVDPSSGTEDEVFDKGDESDVYNYPVSSSPDPRGLRFSVVSDKSLSMYGSSEIFDANQQKGEFYQELDSDLEVEIPPLESDADILSDTSLPLPSPPSFAKEPPTSPIKPGIYDESPPRRQRTISRPGDPWDDLRGGKLIAIAASPTATMDKHFVFPPTGNDRQEDPAYRDPAETMQHHPYLDGQPITKFLPPPPPKMYRPPQRSSWAKEEDYTHSNGSPNRSDGEYVRVQRSVSMREQGLRGEEGEYARLQRTESGRQGSLPRRGGGKRKGFLPKQLHLAIVCSVCILSLVTGVYSKLGSNKMQVHITVYAPPSFLAKDIAVYFNQNKPGHLIYMANNVKAYDMTEPTIEKMNSTLCDGNTCAQGCDEDTGLCICRKGYKFNNKGECKDVNECHAGTFRCHKDAGCLNTEGSYKCMCTGQFYGDGKTCEECDAPCREGTYEFQACEKNLDKTCRECTKECSSGFYMHKACGKKEDTICRMCQKKCGDTQFEYKRCSRLHNRECKERSSLQQPHTSPNMIIENKLDKSTDEQTEMPYTAKFNVWRNTFKKGSGFYVEVDVKYFHPAALFQPVNHDLQHDLPHYHGNRDVLGDHCPYPVPSKYELFYTTHKNMTYKRETYHDTTVIGPCETYMRHGQYPPTGSAPDSSILCAEPGPVSSVFAVDKEFSTSSTVWVEQSEKCLDTNEACFNCTWNCAKPMMLQGGECSVSEKDNGRSPRLPTCFTCCCQRNCSDVCESHHNYRCKTERCEYGNLLEFQLKPIYSGSKRNFYCHMTPVTNQKLMELRYTIRHKYTTLMSQSFTIHGDKSWQEHGKLKSNDHIVNVEIDSKLHTMPDMIEASARADKAKVGVYKSKGSEAKMTYIAGSSALVRPSQPFRMTASTFGSKLCEEEALEHLILATGSEPYKLYPDLIGEFQGNYTYVITNKTATPIVKIGIASHTSVLSSLYPMGMLKKDSLKGNITHNMTHWVLNVTGELTECPGVLSINISDPAYATVPLYQYDVQIKCPHKFSLEFYTPNGDTLTSDKEYIIRVRDSKGVLQLHLYKPASRMVQKMDHSFTTGVSMTQSKEAVQPPHFSIPFIASVCGAVMLLIFIAAFGILIKFGQPQGDVLRFHWCHLVLVVVYITVQFLYAIFISMTIFSLIILAVNSDTMAFLKNYQEQRSVKTALSHLELDNMERHLHAELGRQNYIAAESKAKCEQDMKTITNGFEQMRQLMEKDVKNKIERENLRDLLTKHTRELLQKFTYDMNTFKERYISFVRHTEKTFAADIKQTFDSVSKNKWFKGASFLHRAVKNLREFVNSPTKPFMEWIGIDQDLSQMSQGLSIPTPKSPRFDAVFQASSGPKDTRTANAITNNNIGKKDKFVEVHNIWVSSDKGNGNRTYKSYHGRSRTESAEREEAEHEYNSYYFFLVFMILIDIAWFLHRMLKAVGIARLFLFGYPIFVDIREKTDATAPDGSMKRQSKLFKTGVGKSCSDFIFKTLSSMFVPKVIATVFVCLFVYVISVATFHFVNRETFSYLGYYNNMDDLLRLNEALINRRIESHARRINIMEYPTYQELMNLYVKRHLHLHQSIEGQWHTLHGAHSQFYCQYLQSLDPKAECSSSLETKFRDLSLASCEFEQVQPNFYLRMGRSDSTVAEVQMDAFLTSIRRLISDTCYIVLIYMSTVIIKELLGTVIWLYLKRSGFINLRIIYEADEPPPSRQVKT